jgi:hypothetical protein
MPARCCASVETWKSTEPSLITSQLCSLGTSLRPMRTRWRTLLLADRRSGHAECVGEIYGPCRGKANHAQTHS